MATEGQVKWRGKKSAMGCLHYLCLSETLADVWLTFKDEGSARLPAHKFVLRMRSEVFEAMIDSESFEVHFDDVSKGIMELLLRFLYTDELHLNEENVFQLLYAAKKFMLEGLHEQCVQFLLKSVDAINVCDIYERVQGYDMEDLVSTACLEYIWRHAWKVFTTENFLKLSTKSLTVILDSDSLTGEEILAFRAVVKWAENQCILNNEEPRPENLQTHIRDTVYKIRFPLMSIEEFTEEVQPKCVLTPEDSLFLSQYITDKDDDKNLRIEKFSANPRNGGIMTENIFNSYPDPDRVPGGFDQKCCMFILTTEDIRLHSLKGPLIKYIKTVKMSIQPRSMGVMSMYETCKKMLETEDVWKPVDYSILEEDGEIIFTHNPILMPDSITYMRFELVQRLCGEGQNVDPVTPPLVGQARGKRARGAGRQNRGDMIPVTKATNMSLIVKKTTVSLTLIPPGISQISFR
ncbi:BTB/POZ domain-containing protein 2-like [Mercenaria mercenaria]|uniref:BTB/POZ domain-containing protein 2-like n=1 Tax=Mercenaria mercenaria TaxID=6596 RepID=UPI00234E4A89|nr:BTB/POZ domain-containing protein 2-like [Mercenaria mercenaria]XP_053378418.1 BTB/POZ domain-containing protein 2-like [Mercenaria mercenaria]XP_053378419.1 BTB/POZ domain-containing protein 2-like [Mercenaria mercenaria]